MRWNATRACKADHALHMATVETVFGVIKEMMGFRRGLHAVGSEWTLVSIAWYLGRMHAMTASA